MTPSAAVPTVTRQARLWWPVLVGGGVLGLFAFVGDEVPGVVGLVILTLTSTGFIWAVGGPQFCRHVGPDLGGPHSAL
ncbi:hypothetical protein [Micromonospora sp. NPDC003241]